jgi:hypothetical protein
MPDDQHAGYFPPVPGPEISHMMDSLPAPGSGAGGDERDEGRGVGEVGQDQVRAGVAEFGA